jgi:hypothetical protein
MMKLGQQHYQTYQEQAFNLLTSLEWATNRTGSSLASSNDLKGIQFNNLAFTPQPMTAALIFRRQLVRRSLETYSKL